MPYQTQDESQARVSPARLAELVAWDFQHDVLDRLTRHLFACQTESELADRLLTAVGERSGARASALLLRDEDGCFRPLACQGLEGEASRQVCYEPRPSILWQMLQNGEPITVCDAGNRPMFPETFRKSNLDQLHSRYWMPLCWGGQVRALLTLDREPTDETARRFLSILLERASLAWERVETLFTTLKLRRELARQEKSLKGQRRVTALTEDWNQVLVMLEDRFRQLEEILATAVARLEVSKGSIMLLDESTNELVVRAVCGVEPEVAERIRRGEASCLRLKVGEGIAGQVAHNGRAMIVNQVENEPLFLEPQLSQVDNILCVPLEISGLSLGVLNFTNKRNGKRFSREDQRLATRMAQQAAQAINNARLYHLAVRDPATGVYSRAHFYHRLGDEVVRARRYQRPLTLLSVTLDGLTALRRRQGHALGNQLECELVTVLQTTVRETDLVGRLGESSFGVLLPETDATGSCFLAERFLQEAERQPGILEHNARCLVGVCSFPDRGNSPQKLVSRAELAMEMASRTPQRIQVYLGDELHSFEEARLA